MHFGRGLSHLWKAVALAFGAVHAISRDDTWELIMDGKHREQGKTGTLVCLLVPPTSEMQVTCRRSWCSSPRSCPRTWSRTQKCWKTVGAGVAAGPLLPHTHTLSQHSRTACVNRNSACTDIQSVEVIAPLLLASKSCTLSFLLWLTLTHHHSERQSWDIVRT